MKVGIYTLGCKVNAYESEYVINLLKKNNYQVCDFEDICDVYIINTCTVTNTSDIKSKKIIRQAKRRNPDALVIAMGCFIQANPNLVIDDVDILIGNKDKSKIIDFIENYFKDKKKVNDVYNDLGTTFEDMYIDTFAPRTRAFVKIQDGCENFCSYCIIPYVRGRVRSKEFNKCIIEVQDLALSGHKEIVLSGIHTGQYNSDNKRLADLINEISKIDEIKRIRLSSVEIVELDEKMMDIIENNDKFVSHLHIPLQAGSDHILKLMNRRYDKEYFMNKVKEIRSLRKDISLSTDVIVGFPGETEDDFNETMEFCKEIGFSKIHVFPYSDRNGTVASRMKDHIDRTIIKDRARKLITLSNELEKEYFEKFIDREEDVLIEEYKDGYFHGFTSNYIPVKLKGNYEINSLINIKLTKENINFDLNQ